MTKERAIDLCHAIDQYLCAGNPIWDVKQIHDAMSTAIEALQEQKIGKWIREVLGSTSGYGTTVMYQCTNCEKMSVSKYKFCPNCGASMRSKEE